MTYNFITYDLDQIYFNERDVIRKMIQYFLHRDQSINEVLFVICI